MGHSASWSAGGITLDGIVVCCNITVGLMESITMDGITSKAVVVV